MQRLAACSQTLCVYLRTELFTDADGGRPGLFPSLSPLFGERDLVLERLAGTRGEAIGGGYAASSLFVESIAQAMATRVTS
jgi:hypothetical protein